MPEPIPTIIAEHHLPQIWQAEIEDLEELSRLLQEDPLVTLISLAELITRHGEIGVQLDAEKPPIPDIMLHSLGLDENDLAEVLSQVDMFKTKSEAFFNGMTG